MGIRDDGTSHSAQEAADSAALGRLLRLADEAIVVPPDLWERISGPGPAEAESRPDTRISAPRT